MVPYERYPRNSAATSGENINWTWRTATTRRKLIVVPWARPSAGRMYFGMYEAKEAVRWRHSGEWLSSAPA
jgi:hypothetical protein